MPPGPSVRAYTGEVPTRRRPIAAVPVEELAPAFEPVIEPVVERLGRLEKVVLDIREALDVQFKRTAAMQAQLDRLLAEITKLRP